MTPAVQILATVVLLLAVTAFAVSIVVGLRTDHPWQPTTPLPRIDTVYAHLDGSGTGRVAGTPAAEPVAPAVPEGAVALGQLRVHRPGAVVTAADVIDTRPARETSRG